MIEATLIYPVLILALITVMYFVINIYIEVVAISEIHMALRKEAGDISKTMISQKEIHKEVLIEEHNDILSHEIQGSLSTTISIYGIIKRVEKKKYEASMNIVDEEKYIRCIDVARGIIEKAQ